MPEPSKSTVIKYFGDYVLFGEIGRGATGTVHRARQKSTKATVAVKLIHPLSSELAWLRLRTEAEATARLKHPNIVGILEVGKHEGLAFLAMEFVEGESLAERIERLGANIKEREAALLMAKMARAVHHAHQRGVLHRDLKPGNILIDEAGEPRLIDFGLAKCIEQDSGMTQTGVFIGTPAYASPEQAKGDTKSLTIASDIYSLGAILYAILTGRPPFIGTTSEIIQKAQSSDPPPPGFLRPGLSVNLETICLKCLEKEPERRYASAENLAEDLERFLEGKPITARPIGAFERIWMWARRNPAPASLGLVTFLLILGLLASILLWRKAQLANRQNNALIQLRSATAERLVGFPKKISWRARAEKYVAAASTLADRAFYRDQVAATCEGLDAVLVTQRPAFLNEQLIFDGNTLFLAGPTNTESWHPGAEQKNESATGAAYPGKPVAFLKNAPLQVIRTSAGKYLVWQGQQNRLLSTLELPAGLSIPDGEEEVLSGASTGGRVLGLILRNDQKSDVAVFWELPAGKPFKIVEIGFSVTAFEISPDGMIAACGNPAGRVGLWDIPTGTEIEQFSSSSLPVRSFAFGADIRRTGGRANERKDWLLATGDDGGSIKIWNLAAHRVQTVCRGGHYQVFSLAFSPDGMLLASGGRGPVRLWDAASGMPLLDLAGDYCGALSFSEDGSLLAAGMEHHLSIRQINVWELQNGQGVATLRGLSSSITKIAFAPQGDYVAAIGMGWEVGVWQLMPRKLVHVFETPHGFTADNLGVAFSRDGRLLAISTGEEAQLWEVASGQQLRSWKLPPGLADVLSFPTDHELFLLRMETLQGTEMPLSNAPWPNHPRVCRLRNLLAAEPMKPIREITDFNVGVFDIATSSDGRFFALEGISATNETRVRNILAIKNSTGENVWQTGSTNHAAWGKLSFTSSGAQLAFTANGQQYRLKNLLEANGGLPTFDFPPTAIGPEQTLWAARGDETGAGRGISWFEGGKPRVNLGLDSEILMACCFDHTGRWLAWGNTDGTVSIADLPEIRAALVKSDLAW
jgi:eukaryotic-like serine/threonine-protein kinase